MNEELHTLPPFIDFCVKILGYEPSVYDDYAKCFTYLECLTYTYTYLKNQVIPAVDAQNAVIEEMKDYMDHYFDNLDVQEEINNKLDQMALSGTLTNLIAGYVDPIYEAYETEINDSIDSIENDITDFKNNVNNELNNLRSEITIVGGGSPLVVSSVTDMTDTSRIYVNSTNGSWYFYNGSNWEAGGTYQSTGIADNSVTMDKLSYEFKDDSDNLLNSENSLVDKVWSINQPVTSNVTTTNSMYESYPAIPVTPGDVLIPLYKDGRVYNKNIDQIIYYNEDGSYNSYALIAYTNFPITIPSNIYYIKITTQKAYHLTQLKLYDSGNYNPNYEPYKYIPKILFKDDIGYLSTFNDLEPNYIDNAYIIANPSSPAVGNQNTDQYSSSMSVTGFIKVYPGNKITMNNIYAVSSAGACAYNSNKQYVETIITNSANTTFEYTVPDGVSYIRATILTSNKNIVNGKVDDIKYYDIINNGIEKIGLSLDNLCNTYANKPVLTLIDDDCNISSIPTVKSICDSFGVKCTFGLITKDLSSNQLKNLLKSYQEEGFHITSHTDTHDRWYKNTDAGNMFTLNECESDLIKSLVKMTEETFLDNDYIIAPGSSFSRNGIDKIIGKWAKCFVANTYNKSYNNLYNPNEFNIARTMMTVTSHDLNFYKEWIDTAYTNKSWIILGTHSYNTYEFDSTLYSSIIEYAITKGFEIKTLNEAFKERAAIYTLANMLR